MTTALAYRPATISRERAIDAITARYRRQCMSVAGADKFICDWIADPTATLARIIREACGAPDRTDECERDVGHCVLDIVGQELRRVAAHKVGLLAEAGEIE